MLTLMFVTSEKEVYTLATILNSILSGTLKGTIN